MKVSINHVSTQIPAMHAPFLAAYHRNKNYFLDFVPPVHTINEFASTICGQQWGRSSGPSAFPGCTEAHILWWTGSLTLTARGATQISHLFANLWRPLRPLMAASRSEKNSKRESVGRFVCWTCWGLRISLTAWAPRGSVSEITG